MTAWVPLELTPRTPMLGPLATAGEVSMAAFEQFVREIQISLDGLLWMRVRSGFREGPQICGPGSTELRVKRLRLREGRHVGPSVSGWPAPLQATRYVPGGAGHAAGHATG